MPKYSKSFNKGWKYNRPYSKGKKSTYKRSQTFRGDNPRILQSKTPNQAIVKWTVQRSAIVTLTIGKTYLMAPNLADSFPREATLVNSSYQTYRVCDFGVELLPGSTGPSSGGAAQPYQMAIGKWKEPIVGIPPQGTTSKDVGLYEGTNPYTDVEGCQDCVQSPFLGTQTMVQPLVSKVKYPNFIQAAGVGEKHWISTEEVGSPGDNYGIRTKLHGFLIGINASTDIVSLDVSVLIKMTIECKGQKLITPSAQGFTFVKKSED